MAANDQSWWRQLMAAYPWLDDAITVVEILFVATWLVLRWQWQQEPRATTVILLYAGWAWGVLGLLVLLAEAAMAIMAAVLIILVVTSVLFGLSTGEYSLGELDDTF